MASFRTGLALDRTTLAWIRTTLTMASFGFGMVAFFRSLRQENASEETIRLHHGAVQFGVGLILLGLVATLLAAASHWSTVRRLRLGQQPVLRQWPLSITVALLVGVLCLAGLWAVFMS
jgi:putative membrane protein